MSKVFATIPDEPVSAGRPPPCRDGRPWTFRTGRWTAAALAPVALSALAVPGDAAMTMAAWAGAGLAVMLAAAAVATIIFERRQARAVPTHRRIRDRAAAPNQVLAGQPAAPVVMLAYYYPPHNEIGAARPHRFARYLRLRGRIVAVVCSSTMLRRATDRRALVQAASERPAPHRVPILPGSSAATRSLSAMLALFQRVVLPCDDRLDWLPHAYCSARRALTDRSILVSTHPPVVTHLAALALKLRYGNAWVADFRDPLWGNPSRMAVRARIIDAVIERMVVRTADAVIANTDNSARLLRTRYPALASKIHTIWNGFDPADIIRPLPLPLRDRLVISHIGTLYGDRTPLPFLLSLDRLIVRGALRADRVQFRQIGRIDLVRYQEDLCGLQRMSVPGCLHASSRHLPQQTARNEMLGSDILLLLDINHANPGLQIPAKAFDYIRSGRPILALTVPGSATCNLLALAGVPHVCVDVRAAPAMMDATILSFLQARHPPSVPSAEFEREFSALTQIGALSLILDRLEHARAAELAGASVHDPGPAPGRPQFPNRGVS